MSKTIEVTEKGMREAINDDLVGIRWELRLVELNLEGSEDSVLLELVSNISKSIGRMEDTVLGVK